MKICNRRELATVSEGLLAGYIILICFKHISAPTIYNLCLIIYTFNLYLIIIYICTKRIIYYFKIIAMSVYHEIMSVEPTLPDVVKSENETTSATNNISREIWFPSLQMKLECFIFLDHQQIQYLG